MLFFGFGARLLTSFPHLEGFGNLGNFGRKAGVPSNHGRRFAAAILRPD